VADEPCLLLRMLGSFEVCLDGGAVPLKPQALRLLALLAVYANKSVSRTTIIDVVWDGEIPEVRNEANQIQVHIKAIRDALARGGISRDAVEALGPGRYKLHSPPLVTDLGLFNGKLAEAEDFVAAGSLAQAGQTLTEALALWSGPALDGLSGRFAEAESARLEEQKLNALQRRIDIDLWRERYREQVAELASLVRSRPADDSFRVRLMLALHGSGRTSEALEAFRDGRKILIEDLGVQPGAALCSAHGAILAGQPVKDILAMLIPLTDHGPARPAARRPGQPHCLPAAAADFTGRALELSALDQILAESQPAASASTCTWIVETSPHLWLRSGPGFDYPTVDRLYYGQQAYGHCDGVESGGTTWYLLRRNGDGWAWGNSEYLQRIREL
jgi:DNA-binding SARP family transcriptional activator